MTIQEQENLYTSGLYTKRPIAIVRGLGARLWDSDGKVYIDCAGAQGAGNLGHANASVADAIASRSSHWCPASAMWPITTWPPWTTPSATRPPP